MLRADLAVYNARNELVLTVEIKNLRDFGEEWASQLRRNILAHGNYPHAKYFLLVSPDKFFLWIDDKSDSLLRNPDYMSDATTTLDPFFAEFNVESENVSSFIFEEIVRRWLMGIMYTAYRNENEDIPAWVGESGLGEAVFQGGFSVEKAA